MAQLSVHKIVWKLNSPYGTYVAGDEVEVLWDDSTESLVVEKNGGVITSGSSIPFVFTYSGQSSFYYKTEEHYFPLVCTTLREKVQTYRDISSFPYLSIVKYDAHPSCAVTPVVCDLSFDSLPSIVNASAIGNNDGQITVSATSSNGAIQYKLNSDFVYGSGDASGIFTDLLPGVYVVYARDAINCVAEISVTVGIDYSYGTLLEIIYKDFVGNNSKVELLEKSYAGSATEVDGWDHSCFYYTLRGEGEIDKFKAIISSESTLNLVSIENFEFINLFTSDPDKYRVRFSKDIGSGYEFKLLHKFLPNQYSEDYKNPPYQSSFVAGDGTATLKDIAFSDSNGGRLFGKYKQITLIAFILNKLNLGINIRCSINLYAETMDMTDTDDPLDQAYVDVDCYYLNAESPSCEDVLKAILEPYGAQLIQWDGVWNIKRVEERVGEYEWREFDTTGVFSSNGTYNPVKDSASKDDANSLYWLASPSMQMMPGYGLIKTNYKLGLSPNILLNGDFRLKRQYNWVSGNNEIVVNIDGFQIVHNSTNVQPIQYEVIDNSNVALKHFATANTYIQSNNYTLKMSFSDKIKFKVSYKNSPVQRDYPYQKIKAQVRYGTYYLQSDGAWTTTANTLIFYSKEFGRYANFEIIAGQPDATALDGLVINVRVYFSFVLDAEFITLTDLRAKVTTTLLLATRTELLPSSTGGGVDTNYIYYYELENNTNAESVPDIVRPTDYNGVTNPVQWILKKTLSSNTSGINNDFFIDRIAVEYLPEGKDAPQFFNANLTAETNNSTIFEKELRHGSLTNDIESNLQFGVTVLPLLFDNLFPGISPVGDFLNGGGFFSLQTTGTENADKIYTGYLRDGSSVGYVNWSRDNVSESRLLHEIYLRTISAQYSRPWRKIFGTLISRDTYFTPIDTIRETFDNDRFYYPIALTVDDKRNEYNGEFVELLDVTDESSGGSGGGGSGGSGVGFTTGFTIGFDS